MPPPMGRKATYTLNQIQRKTRCDKVAQRLDQTPNGKWCVLAVFFATLAWILTLSAPVPCSYVRRNVKLNKEIPPNVSTEMHAVIFQSHGVGFWGWYANGNCLSFEISGKKPSLGGVYGAASAFSTLTVLVGGAGMVCLWLGVCFPFRPERFRQFGVVLIVAILFSALTDLIFFSSVCKADFFQYVTSTITVSDSIEASCSLSTGSLLNISATIFLLLAAIICEVSPLAKGTNAARRPAAPAQTIPPMGDSDRLVDRFDDEEFDDEGSALQRQRKLETERRYREMFGDEDPDDSVLLDDDKVHSRGSSPTPLGGVGLDPVQEGSEHLSSEHRGNGTGVFGGDDADDEISKGSRSRGTRGSRSRGSRSRHSSRHSTYSDEDDSRESRGSHSRGSHSYFSGRGDNENRSRGSRSGGSRSRDSRSRGSRSHYSDGDRSYSGDDRSREGSQYSRSVGSPRSDNHRDDPSQGSRSYFSRSYHDDKDDRSKGERSDLL